MFLKNVYKKFFKGNNQINNKGDNKMSRSQSKTVDFLRKNGIYIVMALCIIAIGFAVIFMSLPSDNSLSGPGIDASNPNDDVIEDPVNKPDTPPTDTPNDPVSTTITFVMPVSNATMIGEYSETMVWSSTLSRYSTHKAIDFFAPEGTDVVAVYDGTVESVTNSILEGYTITIDHGNGLKTVYNSLADGDLVSEGQVIKAGDVIGQVSVTNRQEYKSGAHLHFEVFENGENIDPIKYLNIDNK